MDPYERIAGDENPRSFNKGQVEATPSYGCSIFSDIFTLIVIIATAGILICLIPAARIDINPEMERRRRRFNYTDDLTSTNTREGRREPVDGVGHLDREWAPEESFMDHFLSSLLKQQYRLHGLKEQLRRTRENSTDAQESGGNHTESR